MSVVLGFLVYELEVIHYISDTILMKKTQFDNYHSFFSSGCTDWLD